MKAIDHHLYDRNGRFYYRSTLPRNLKPFIPFYEIKLSLGTSDLGQARLYVARLDIEVQRLIESVYKTLEKSPTPEGLEQIKRLVEGCYDSLRGAVGLSNIRQSPHWYSSALNATGLTPKANMYAKTVLKAPKCWNF